MTSRDSVDEIVAAYLVDRDEGRVPDVAAIVAANPEHADELREFFEAESFWEIDREELPQIDVGRFGDFVVEREIGRGGWGVVYEAKPVDGEESFALKVLAGRLVGQSELTRFRNEAELLQQLKHPNIVEILDAGQIDGSPYYTMPLMHEHLGEMIQRHQRDKEASGDPGIEIDRVVALARQVANGLAHAHRAGVIHRDVKPSNILIGDDGLPRLADFGLARAHDRSTMTTSADIVGTLRYTSPEQLLGERAAVDQRTDIYSLGATIWEMLALRPVVAGDDRQRIIHAVLHEKAPAIARYNSAVPHDLETVVMKCLRKDVTERYQSANALAQDLQRFARRETIVAKRPSPFEKVLRWVKDNQRLAAAILGCVGIAMCASVVSSVLVWRAGQAAVENERIVIEALARAEASELNAKRMLYDAEMEQATTAWLSGNSPQTRMRLEEVANLDPDRKLRHLEWDFLWRECSAESERLLEVSDAIYCLERVPNSKEFVTAGLESLVRFHDGETGEVQKTLSTGQTEINSIDFSPNTQLMATAGDDGTVKIWACNDHELVTEFKAGDHVIWTVMFLSDEQVATSSGKGHFDVFSVTTGELVETYSLSRNRKPVNHQRSDRFAKLSNGAILTCRNAVRCWSPGSEKWELAAIFADTRVFDVAVDEHRGLAFFAGYDQLIVCELDTLKPIQRIKQLNHVRQVEVFPNRGLVAIGVRGGEIRVYSIQDDKSADNPLAEVNAWTLGGNPETLLATQDEEFLLYSVANELYRATLKHSEPLGRIEPAKIVGSPHSGKHVSYLLDGTLVDTKLRAMTSDAKMGDYSISADGDYLAGISADPNDRVVKVWSIKEQRLVYCEAIPSPILNQIRISADGKYLAFFHDNSPDRRQGLFAVLDWRANDFPIWDESGWSRFEAEFDLENRVIYRPNERLLCRDCRTGKIVWRQDDAKMSHFTIHPNKNLIAVANNNRQLEIRETSSGEIVRRFPIPPDIAGLAFTSDGKRLACVESGDFALTILSAESGKRLLRITNRMVGMKGKGMLEGLQRPAFISGDRTFAVRRRSGDTLLIDFGP